MTRVPRVAAIHDICGLGRCSMTAVLPVLSVMGAQCCPLLTASLSAHMGFPPSEKSPILDLTQQMAGTAAHWGELDCSFDAIYSGFLASEAQIAIIQDFYNRFRTGHSLVLVDPVMGDHGRTYRTCTPALCRAMSRLAEQADLITPNLTEAALLLGEDYAAVPRNEAGMRQWLGRLSLGGRRSVIITGVSFAPGQIGAGCFDRESGQIHFAMARQEDGSFPGTGDLFASVVLGSLLQGNGLPHGMELAVSFVQRCAKRTLALGTSVLEGVQFEPLLGELAGTR